MLADLSRSRRESAQLNQYVTAQKSTHLIIWSYRQKANPLERPLRGRVAWNGHRVATGNFVPHARNIGGRQCQLRNVGVDIVAVDCKYWDSSFVGKLK